MGDDRPMRFRFTAVLALTAATLACGQSPTSTGLVTDTFTGSVVAGGYAGYQIPVTTSGNVVVTLVSLSPQSTITMGIGIGTQDASGTCTFFGQNESFHVGDVLGDSFVAGVYCVVIYDVGNVTGSVAYTLTVSHP
jgi:hypothetical protein